MFCKNRDEVVLVIGEENGSVSECVDGLFGRGVVELGGKVSGG